MQIEEVVKHYPKVTGIHDLCFVFPEMEGSEFDELIESVQKNGLLDKIALTEDGQLLDGRHRLIACYVAKVEPRFEIVRQDLVQYVLDKNLNRRHLTAGQRSFVALRFLDYEKKKAKERQATLNNDSALVANFPQAQTGKSRDKVGQQVGVSGRSVEKAKRVQEDAPDIVPKILKGEVSLDAAYREARKREKSKEATAVEPVKPKPAPKKRSTFNRTNDSVDWASWTWNPVTGCEHGCKFCYAREIAHSARMSDIYPNKFNPTFHADRLDAPKNTKVPEIKQARDGRVFVCSMADLFGKWVPVDWIEQVFAACLQSPEWEYLFLTKWPARYSEMPLMENAWYGASVIQQSDVKRVEKAMLGFHVNAVKWISMEPMLEPIRFNDLSWCDLVVIGGQTSTNQPDGFVPEFAPEFDWVVDVVNQCREWDVPYYLKTNLGLDRPGMNLPKMSPREK